MLEGVRNPKRILVCCTAPVRGISLDYEVLLGADSNFKTFWRPWVLCSYLHKCTPIYATYLTVKELVRRLDKILTSHKFFFPKVISTRAKAFVDITYEKRTCAKSRSCQDVARGLLPRECPLVLKHSWTFLSTHTVSVQRRVCTMAYLSMKH